MCRHPQMPTDKLVVSNGIPMRQWRYVCEVCEWVWANPLQRAHNEQQFRRGVNILKRSLGL